MYLALFMVAMLFLYVEKEEKQPFFKYGVCSALLVLFPLTGWVLNKYFQGFYQPEAWQWLLPVFGVVAYAVMKLAEKPWGKWQKRTLLPAVCLVIVMSGCLAKAYRMEQNRENVQEIREVYETVLSQSGEREVLLAAPKEVLEGARAYDARLLTVYGRDIWEQELDYAFYDRYEDWAYALAEHMEEPMDGQKAKLLRELALSGATHVVFDKENMIFDGNMQYPAVLYSGNMTLQRLEETRHYVIYIRGE